MHRSISVNDSRNKKEEKNWPLNEQKFSRLNPYLNLTNFHYLRDEMFPRVNVPIFRIEFFHKHVSLSVGINTHFFFLKIKFLHSANWRRNVSLMYIPYEPGLTRSN